MEIPSTIHGMSDPTPTQLPNGYALVDGVKMHAAQGDRFQIPHVAMRRHVAAGDFVEVRIDSARFSVPPDAHAQCDCPQCNEPTSNPILCHEEPGSLVPIPRQQVPARGWGEQFWIHVTAREGEWLTGLIDNRLHESRLHDLHQGDSLTIHEDHILAVHRSNHQDLLLRMSQDELVAFGQWLKDQGLIP